MRPLIRTTFNLEKIKCYSEGGDDSIHGWGSAEPYLWTIFYKIDGTTVRLGDSGRLEGHGTFKFHNTSHNNLPNQDVDAGDVVNIPAAIGQWSTMMTPIPIAEIWKDLVKGQTGWDDLPGITGCIYVLLEEDLTSSGGAETGHQRANQIFEQEINALIPTLGLINQQIPSDFEARIKAKITSGVVDAIKKTQLTLSNFWRIINPDDVVGGSAQRYSHDDLTNHSQKNFSTRWNSEGSWELFGSVKTDYVTKKKMKASLLKIKRLHPNSYRGDNPIPGGHTLHYNFPNPVPNGFPETRVKVTFRKGSEIKETMIDINMNQEINFSALSFEWEDFSDAPYAFFVDCEVNFNGVRIPSGEAEFYSSSLTSSTKTKNIILEFEFPANQDPRSINEIALFEATLKVEEPAVLVPQPALLA